MVFLSNNSKAALDGLLSRAVEDGIIPAAALVVGTADKELYSGSAGVQAFGEPTSGKIDKDTVFWICSQTKLIVTVAILQLVEQGVLTYDTPVTDIIPELADPVIVDDVFAKGTPSYKPAQTTIVIKHLLNHSSGIYYGFHREQAGALPAGYNGGAYEGDHSVEKFFKIIKNDLPSVPLAFEPGTNWIYGWNTDVLAFIVERLTKKTIEEYSQDNIFRPLGMKTSFNLTPAMREHLVQLTYRRSSDGALEKWAGQLKIIEQDFSKLNVLLGGIGLYSTLSDYLTLLRHLLSIEAGTATKPILSTKTVADMFRPSVPAHSSKNLYQLTLANNCQFGLGLCLTTEDWPGRRKKGSGFWWGWAGTYYFMDPTTGIAAVYGTQVVPPIDTEVVKLWEALETAIYAGLEA